MQILLGGEVNKEEILYGLTIDNEAMFSELR